MKYKIGVFGSAAGELDKVIPKAKELGRELAAYNQKVIVVTGGCSGLPYIIAAEAAKGGIEIWGYSAELNKKEHYAAMPDDDHSIYSKIIYVPRSFPFAHKDRPRKKYRNVISTANCDAGIVIAGRWGTLNEFTNLVDFQKVVGILTSTGGVADELPKIMQKISKEGQGSVIFDSDPQKLLSKVMAQLKKYKK
jgi:predicted Rossmann-fold nucleotide-binding protein